MSMRLEKDGSYVYVDYVEVYSTTVYENDGDTEIEAVSLDFSNGAFILKDGGMAEIKLDEGTSSICNISPRCIFTSASITVDNGRAFISVMEADGVLSNYAFYLSDLTTLVSFGHRRD